MSDIKSNEIVPITKVEENKPEEKESLTEEVSDKTSDKTSEKDTLPFKDESDETKDASSEEMKRDEASEASSEEMKSDEMIEYETPVTKDEFLVPMKWLQWVKYIYNQIFKGVIKEIVEDVTSEQLYVIEYKIKEQMNKRPELKKIQYTAIDACKNKWNSLHYKHLSNEALLPHLFPFIKKAIDSLVPPLREFKLNFEKNSKEEEERIAFLFEGNPELKTLYSSIESRTIDQDAFFKEIQLKSEKLEVTNDDTLKEYVKLVSCLYIKLTHKMPEIIIDTVSLQNMKPIDRQYFDIGKERTKHELHELLFKVIQHFRKES
jgi:hypothetical protein